MEQHNFPNRTLKFTQYQACNRKAPSGIMCDASVHDITSLPPNAGETLLYHFHSCVLDLVRGSLYVSGRKIDLRPKSFEVLRYLVENPDRLVSKDELIKSVWPSTVVTDDSLTNCISEVRRAVSDRAQEMIKTVPRRGYLFAAPVAREDAVELKRVPDSAMLESATGKPSIAVLAFANMSGDSRQEYLSDGITEDIITELSRFSEVLVIARNSSFQYKGKAVDVRQIGRELGVAYVLKGSIRRHEDRVRITAQLVDGATGAHRWAERYDRKLEDVFAIQDDVARTIVTILVAHVNKAEIESARNKPPVSWQAYDYYLRATDTLGSYLSSFKAEDLYETRRLLQHSLSTDPNYARAHAVISRTHLRSWLDPLDGDFLKPATLDRAYQAARRAVQLDPNLPEARAHLGTVLSFQAQHGASLAEFDRAVVLNPNFTDYRFAAALVRASEPVRALEVIEKHMRLDPFYPAMAPGWLGLAHYMLKEYSKALPPLRECVSRAPNFLAGRAWLTAAYAQAGRLKEARAEADEVLRIEPNYTIEGTQRQLSAYKNSRDVEHFLDGLRKAGLPKG